jgi:hypothetical protein
MPVSDLTTPGVDVGDVCRHTDTSDSREVDAVPLVRKHGHGFDVEAHNNRYDREDDCYYNQRNRRIEFLLGVGLNSFPHSVLQRLWPEWPNQGTCELGIHYTPK